MADRPNLPAPYTSPWRQLQQAVVAVLASLRLDLRSLWRRNNSGELPRPSWWPRDLAPLLWPLLLSAAMALLLAAGLRLYKQAPQAPPHLQSQTPTQTPTPLPAETTSSAAEPSPVAQPPAASSPPTQQERPQQSTPAAQANVLEQQPQQPPLADPLLAAMGQAGGLELIDASTSVPEQGLLQLRLNARYGGLSPKQQRRLAERWLERSLELGFDQLKLVASDGHLLGYRARVGSGMILLDPDRPT